MEDTVVYRIFTVYRVCNKINLMLRIGAHSSIAHERSKVPKTAKWILRLGFDKKIRHIASLSNMIRYVRKRRGKGDVACSVIRPGGNVCFTPLHPAVEKCEAIIWGEQDSDTDIDKKLLLPQEPIIHVALYASLGFYLEKC
jgi:hypothetical protein